MDRTNLLPIGQFAQASGLSVTALRHYDASGVLTPAFVDPASGYRYFRRDQLRSAQLVRALRQLDMPIERVRELLAGGAGGAGSTGSAGGAEDGAAATAELAAALRAQIEAAERRLDLQRSVVHSLLTRLTEGAEMNHRVTLRQSIPERVLVRGATVNHHGLDPFLRTAYEELYAIAGRGPLTFTGPAFVRYHGLCDEENETLVEACLPFWESGAQPGELGEGMSVRDVPECTYACTVVEGEATAFPAVLAAYDAVANWVVEHGFTFSGPVRSTFLRWTGTADHPDNRLEIAWPVTDPSAGPFETVRST
ncbi:MerR family transcriptional regulator [Streptomyces sp. NPDC006553]|uniref:MerR family transcriptional regulator n=1 Tax=unclassified Streptomyces TaxID=2593676 RepID=UPI0022534614|nr:MerR family transcriptional regulator [Streptomyces sp. NBC_00233]MCX5227792.1 MerR family transcriptional regulator [Streptomyces sp. NBC_00233]